MVQDPSILRQWSVVYTLDKQAHSWTRRCKINSNNARVLKQLGWEPTVKLADGLKLTYLWIKDQLKDEADHSGYSKSTIVNTSAPCELGSLREPDGTESYHKAKQAVSKGFKPVSVLGNRQSDERIRLPGHTVVTAA